MDETELHQQAKALIVELQVQHARSIEQDASGWLVVCTDLETGSLQHTGPYPSPVEALIAAAAADASVNAGLPAGEKGWKHTVWPLFPPQDAVWPSRRD